MRNGWTSERRARQAEAIRKWRPWEKSTGPKTTEGKAKCSQNGFKGARRQQARELMRTLSELLKDQRDALDRIA